jgi:hypothetical protein
MPDSIRECQREIELGKDVTKFLLDGRVQRVRGAGEPAGDHKRFHAL